MIIREEPSEEYRRKLQEKHLLEGICLAVSVFILILGALTLLQLQDAMWMLQAMIVLGALLNLGLALRCVLGRMWIGAAGAAVLSAICVCGLIFLLT